MCDLRGKRRNSRLSRCLLSSIERRARRLRPQPANRDAGDHQLVHGPQRGREGRGVDPRERPLGLVEAPDQEQSPDREMTRVRGVDTIAARVERRPCRVERLSRKAQIARDERDLRLGDHAPCASDRLPRTERPRRPAKERLRARQIAQLRHRDASQRKRRRIVSERDPLQRAERIAGRERARRGGD